VKKKSESPSFNCSECRRSFSGTYSGSKPFVCRFCTGEALDPNRFEERRQLCKTDREIRLEDIVKKFMIFYSNNDPSKSVHLKRLVKSAKSILEEN